MTGEFINEYSEKHGVICTDIESVLNDVVEDCLGQIRADLENISKKIESGNFSNSEIIDDIGELIDRV